jgi:hypothetical protein
MSHTGAWSFSANLLITQLPAVSTDSYPFRLTTISSHFVLQMMSETESHKEATEAYNTRHRSKRAPSSPNKKKRTVNKKKKPANPPAEEVPPAAVAKPKKTKGKFSFYVATPEFKSGSDAMLIQTQKSNELIEKMFGGQGTIIKQFNNRAQAQLHCDTTNAAFQQMRQIMYPGGSFTQMFGNANPSTFEPHAKVFINHPVKIKKEPPSPATPPFSPASQYSTGSAPEPTPPPPDVAVVPGAEASWFARRASCAKPASTIGERPRPTDPVMQHLLLAEERDDAAKKFPASSFKTPEKPKDKNELPSGEDEDSDDSADLPPLAETVPRKLVSKSEYALVAEKLEFQGEAIRNPYKKPVAEPIVAKAAKSNSKNKKPGAARNAAGDDTAEKQLQAMQGVSINKSKLSANVKSKAYGSKSAGNIVLLNFLIPEKPVIEDGYFLIPLTVGLYQTTKDGLKLHWMFKPSFVASVLSDDAISFMDYGDSQFMQSLHFASVREHPFGANKVKTTGKLKRYEVDQLYGLLPVDSYDTTEVEARVTELGKLVQSIIPAEWFKEAYLASLAPYEGLQSKLEQTGQLWEDAKASTIAVSRKHSLDTLFMDATIKELMHRMYDADPSQWTETMARFAYRDGVVPAPFYTD